MDRERRIDNEALLRKIDWFESLSADERRRLAGSISGVEFEAGNEIISEGQAGASLYIVVEGLLRVSHQGEASACVTPGQAFGERSLLTGERCNATATAATAGYLLVIGKQNLMPLLHDRPALTEVLAHTMVSRDRDNHRRADRLAKHEERRESKQEIGARIRAFFRL
jgi:CRP-like cAMP-binding protein